MANFWDDVLNAVAGSPAVQATVPQTTGNGDVDSLLSQYGLTLGPAPVVQDDPPVYMGSTLVPGNRIGSTESIREDVLPLSKAQGSIYAWSDEQIRQFQDDIISAGIVTRNQISYGARDATTVAAWNQLVGQAADAYTAGVKLAPRTLLQELKGHPAPGKEGAPLTIELTNPEDLKAGLHDMFRSKLGQGNIDPAKIDAMVAAYQQHEASYQRQQYANAETGGTVVAPPSLATFADEQAKQIDPTAYDAYKVLDKFSVLEKELSGR